MDVQLAQGTAVVPQQHQSGLGGGFQLVGQMYALFKGGIADKIRQLVPLGQMGRNGEGGGLVGEHIFGQPVKGLLHPGQGQSQVHAQMTGAVEHPAVLYRHAHIPAGFFHLVDGLAVGLAPFGAVHKQHVGALGLGYLHTLEVVPDVVAGEVDVAAEHFAELVHPLVALGLVGAHKGVHGQHIHGIVVAEAGLLVHPVLPPLVIDNVIAAHQARQVEGLAGGVHGGGALPGVLGNGLGGDVLVAVEHQVGPDLVRHHIDVVFLEQLHGLFQLPALPDPAAGVVRIAEDGGMDLLLLELLLHVLRIHPPDAVLVLDQGAEHHVVAVVGQAGGESHIGGGVEQHLVAPGADAVQGRHHAAQHAVFVADVFLGKAGDPVALLLPADDGGEILLTGGEIAEGRMLDAVGHGLLDGGNGGEVHVRHPHGDGVKALPGCAGGKAGHSAQTVHSDGVPAVAGQDGSKIVLHTKTLLL